MAQDPSSTPPDAPQGSLFPATPGERLRLAREEKGLTLADVAQQTRISLRNLEGLETSDYSTLPSITYAVGFARAYARVVGVDEVAIARDVRAQSHSSPTARLREPAEEYDLSDIRRGAGRGVVIAALILAVLVVVAALIHFGAGWPGGSTTDDSASSAPAGAPGSAGVAPALVPAAPTPTAGGQVTLTATDEVWMKVRDAGGTLFQGTLHTGDHYQVPATANGPLLTVGRPDKLTVTLNGSQLAPLGDGRRAISDVPVDGASLAARANGQPVPSTGGAGPTAIPAAASPGRQVDARPTPRPSPTHGAAPAAPVPSTPPLIAPTPAATAG